jgi:hypothetical protein
MRKIVQDMLKCDELYHQFVNIIGVDDNKSPEEYDDEDIIAEAKYVLEKYTDASQNWRNFEMLYSDDPEERQTARKEMKQIQNFLKKYAK